MTHRRRLEDRLELVAHGPPERLQRRRRLNQLCQGRLQSGDRGEVVPHVVGREPSGRAGDPIARDEVGNLFFNSDTPSILPANAPIAFLDVITQLTELIHQGVHGRAGKGALGKPAALLLGETRLLPGGGTVVTPRTSENRTRCGGALWGRREGDGEQVDDQRRHGDRQLNA